MKLDAVIARSLLMVAMAGAGALSLVAQTATEPASETAAADSDTKIPGTVISREKGGFLSLTIEGGAFKLSFYDAEKKPVAPDVARATARWDPKNKVGAERRVLNPSGDGLTLVSPPVRPPYNFKLYLVLLPEQEGAPEVEHYVVDFRD